MPKPWRRWVRVVGPFAAATALVGATLGVVARAAAFDVPRLPYVARSGAHVTAVRIAQARGAYEPCEGDEADDVELARAVDAAIRSAYASVFGARPSCGVTRPALVTRSSRGVVDVVATLSCSGDEMGWLEGLVVLVGPERGPLRITQIVRGAQLVPTRVCGGVVRLAPVHPLGLASGASEVLPWTHAATLSSHHLVDVVVRPTPPSISPLDADER